MNETMYGSNLFNKPLREPDPDANMNFDLTSPLDINGNLKEKRDELNIRLEIEGVPPSSPWKIEGIRDLPPNLKGPKVAFLTGIIIAISSPLPYTKWVGYRCTSDECGCLQEKTVFTNQSICRGCSSELVEDPSAREVGELIRINVFCDQPHHEAAAFNFQEPLTLIARDIDPEKIEPGQRIECSLLIFPSTQATNEHPTLEILKICPSVPLRPPSQLPLAIRRLIEDRRDSPWSFALTLSYVFASSVCPPGTFHLLKMALLLSLASCSDDECGLALLAVGKEELIHRKLFRYASKCAPRAIWHSALNVLCGNILKDNNGTTWVEAGSLLLAKGGVCILGDLAYAKQDIANKAFDVLESHQVQFRESLSTLRYPLRASVWSSFDPSYKKPHINSSDEEYTKQAIIGNLKKSITDVFGLVIYSDTSSSILEHTVQMKISLQFLLNMVKSDHQLSPLLSIEDFVQFLSAVRAMKLSFTQKAQDLLRGYYIVSRRLRGDAIKGAAMPITSIETLTKIAKSHAKLSLRSQVETWDVVAAVLLFEETLTSQSGFSPLNVVPAPHLPAASADLHHILGRKNDEKMLQFLRKLEDFITEHIEN